MTARTMFLHSGAGLHKHEYSPNSIDSRRRNTLVRAAFSSPSRLSSASTLTSTSTSKVPASPQAYETSKPASIRSARRSSTDALPRVHEKVRFREPEPLLDIKVMSEDEGSVANSAASIRTGGGSSTRRGRRRSTNQASQTYCLAQAPPKLGRRQKILIMRPRLLLQFQRLSKDSRPVPAFDVLPSTMVVPRLANRFPRIFKGKTALGTNDVMVVRSEDYESADTDEEDGKGVDDIIESEREVLAVICQVRGQVGSVEICCSDGTIWLGTPLPNETFEFVFTDPITGMTTTARWVLRGKRRDSGERKYHFSILQKDTRRHPILASLTSTTLDIPDFYTTPSRKIGQAPIAPVESSFGESRPPSEEEEPGDMTSRVLDEATKDFIKVTASWVALRKGWCVYFKYDDHAQGLKSPSIESPTNGRPRALSLTPDLDRGRAITPDFAHLDAPGNPRRSSAQLLRSSPTMGSPIFGNSQFDGDAPTPKRALSAGAAFMQRAAAARRASKSPNSTASDSDRETRPENPRRAMTGDFDRGQVATPSPLGLQSSPSLSDPDTPTPISRGELEAAPGQRQRVEGVKNRLSRLFPGGRPLSFVAGSTSSTSPSHLPTPAPASTSSPPLSHPAQTSTVLPTLAEKPEDRLKGSRWSRCFDMFKGGRSKTHR